MTELLIAILSVSIGYFFMKLESLEKKIDMVENLVLSQPKRKTDFVDRPKLPPKKPKSKMRKNGGLY